MKEPKLKYTIMSELQKAVIEYFKIHRFGGDIERGDVVEITYGDCQTKKKYKVVGIEPEDDWSGTNTIFLKPLSKGGK